MPVAARRRQVRLSPFPPDGENCDRSLAPPLPGEPAALSFAGSTGEINQNATGDAADGHFVPIGPHPYPLWPFGPSPPDRGSRPRTPLRGTRTCKSAKNFRRAKSEWRSKFPPGHWALAMWKIGAGAVPLPRLAWPSRCSRCWAVGRGLLDAPRMRAGQCPAPTIKKDGFRIHVGAAHRAARLPWIGGRPKGLPYPTLEEFLENRRGGDDSPYQGEMSSAARQRG